MSKKLKILPQEDKPWYSKGLKFECTGCGKCCTGSPGYVWVSKEEIAAIAEYLKIPVDKFVIRYLKKVGKRHSLVEFSKNYDCVFLKDNRCSIYPVRPTQCRTFPWWAQNLSSPEAWQEAAKYCEGITQAKDAPTVPVETIQDQLDHQNNYIETLEN